MNEVQPFLDVRTEPGQTIRDALGDVSISVEGAG